MTRVVLTTARLAAARQIDAAIAHFAAGDFECAITLCRAAEGALPEPTKSASLLPRLINQARQSPAPDGERDDFNYDANWLKHGNGPEEWEIEELQVKFWLYRAVSKYHQVYGDGTSAMASLFGWVGAPRNDELGTPFGPLGDKLVTVAPMRIGLRRPSLRKSFAARVSPARFVRHSLGLKVPRGWGWLTNPRRAAYNRVYARTTVSLWRLLRLLFR